METHIEETRVDATLVSLGSGPSAGLLNAYERLVRLRWCLHRCEPVL